MAEHPATEILDSLMRNLREILRTESIVGEPIQVGKMTILPVIKVAVGFGAGGGAGTPDKAAANGAKSMQASGGGGGGGLSITPVGFLVVEEGRAMMITPQSTRWDWIVESLPDMWEKLVRIRREGKQQKAGSSGDEKTTAGSSAPPSGDGL